MKLMQIFKETITSYESYPGGPLHGNDDEVNLLTFPHKLNIVLEGW